MAIDLAGMQARFPALIDYADTVAAARLQVALDDAVMDVDEAMFAAFYDRAIYNLAAHRYDTQMRPQDEGDSGTSLVASMVVADRMSGTLEVGGGSEGLGTVESGYLSTSYGAEYLRLLRQMGSGARVV